MTTKTAAFSVNDRVEYVHVSKRPLRPVGSLGTVVRKDRAGVLVHWDGHKAHDVNALTWHRPMAGYIAKV